MTKCVPCAEAKSPHISIMEITRIIKANWLTRKPNKQAWDISVAIGAFIVIASLSYFQNFLNAREWMPASFESIFAKQQYWRLWTALFAHADMEHLLSNAILFFPFTYLLTAYYGVWFVPLLGLFFGGLTNLIVVMGMPYQTTLIGISGVVYWLGASWLTLFLLIDQRESMRRRIAKVIIISTVLFAPQAYKPEVSYLSHAVGYLLGILSSLLYYHCYRTQFLNAEEIEYQIETEDVEVS